MAQNKTTETEASVDSFVSSIEDEKRKQDISAMISLMTSASGYGAKMWGSAIVGFGSYHYKYESGREGDMCLAGLASRANAIVLYLSLTEAERETLLSKLGKHKTGKGCIYIQKLEDIDKGVLTKMIKSSVKNLKKQNPG